MPGNWTEMRGILDEDLPAAEKLLFLALRIRCGSNGSCWPSQGRLSRDTGISDRHLRTLTRNLELRGIIATTWRGTDGRQIEYHLNTGSGFRHLAELRSGNPRKSVPKHRKSVADIPETASYEEKKEGKKKEESKRAGARLPEGLRAPRKEGPAISAQDLARLREDPAAFWASQEGRFKEAIG